MKQFLILFVALLIAGFLEAIAGHGTGIASLAMAGFYATESIGLGKVQRWHPLYYSVHRSVETGPMYFGRAVMDGTDPETQIKVFSSSTGVLRGIAEYYEATTVAGEYATGEGADVCESGIMNVWVTEAVDPSSTVRVVHTGTTTAATYASHTATMTSVAGGDATGLANDSTTYTAGCIVGNYNQTITVTGSAAQTYTTLMSVVNAALEGATMTIVGGNLKTTSQSAGAAYPVVWTDTDLFASLTEFTQLEDPVAGTDAVTASEKVGCFAKTASAGKTAVVSGAEFRGTTTGAGEVALFLPAGKKTITPDT